MPHPTPVAPPIQWQTPGDGALADHLAEIAIRHRRRMVSEAIGRRWITYPCVIVVMAVLVGFSWPYGLLVPLFVGVVLISSRRAEPKQVAANLRKLPTADEPYTVTLDVEGLHLVGPSFADHVRWKMFESAAVDEEVLVLRRRGIKLVQAIPLVGLDPGVDRAGLLAGVERAIAVSAPPEGSTA